MSATTKVEVYDIGLSALRQLLANAGYPDSSNGESGAGDFGGIGLFADGFGGIINWFDGCWEIIKQLFEDRNGETKTRHNEHATWSFGEKSD